MCLISFWSAESGLSFPLFKNFPDCFRYETNHFENLQQIYVCALPKIEFSEYFSETKAIYF